MHPPTVYSRRTSTIHDAWAWQARASTYCLVYFAKWNTFKDACTNLSKLTPPCVIFAGACLPDSLDPRGGQARPFWHCAQLGKTVQDLHLLWRWSGLYPPAVPSLLLQQRRLMFSNQTLAQAPGDASLSTNNHIASSGNYFTSRRLQNECL